MRNGKMKSLAAYPKGEAQGRGLFTMDVHALEWDFIPVMGRGHCGANLSLVSD